jgi:hypothetical protein
MKASLCCPDTSVPEMPALEKDKPANSMAGPIQRTFQVLVDALQEIFDESAYRRFLDRRQLQSSVSAYAIFRRENEQAKSRRPRCC